ncbi:Protein of unknown function [Cotesia congregata]|uniref:Uncharacterized protein n=1 Tax=Cotesia congregata TaxID=51543 RepID=A0A8J2H914_COTCN|nr:Protein of unknown function [Cotesia congregata]
MAKDCSSQNYFVHQMLQWRPLLLRHPYLKPVVDEIKILETTGIEIGGQIFKGSLAAMSFDNLGANTIYGMVQPFSATNFCRFCFATKTQTKTMICEDLSIAFNYGKNEMTNKPSPMNLDKPGYLLGERASQMWYLVRYLPFLISDYIEEELVQSKWALIKELLQIMHIVFSPVISHGMKSELDLSIQEHHLILLNEYEKIILIAFVSSGLQLLITIIFMLMKFKT